MEPVLIFYSLKKFYRTPILKSTVFPSKTEKTLYHIIIISYLCAELIIEKTLTLIHKYTKNEDYDKTNECVVLAALHCSDGNGADS